MKGRPELRDPDGLIQSWQSPSLPLLISSAFSNLSRTTPLTMADHDSSPEDKAAKLSRDVTTKLRNIFTEKRESYDPASVDVDFYRAQTPEATKAACTADLFERFLFSKANPEPLDRLIHFAKTLVATKATARKLLDRKASLEEFGPHDWLHLGHTAPAEESWAGTYAAEVDTDGSPKAEWENVLNLKPSKRRAEFARVSAEAMLHSLSTEEAENCSKNVCVDQLRSWYRHLENLRDPSSWTHGRVFRTFESLHPMFDNPSQQWPVLEPFYEVLASSQAGRTKLRDAPKPFSYAETLKWSVDKMKRPQGRDAITFDNVYSAAKNVTHNPCFTSCTKDCSIGPRRYAMAQALSMTSDTHTDCVPFLNEWQSHFDSLTARSKSPTSPLALQSA